MSVQRSSAACGGLMDADLIWASFICSKRVHIHHKRLRTAYITHRSGHISKVLPNSNPVMDSKVLLMWDYEVLNIKLSLLSQPWNDHMDKSETILVFVDAVPHCWDVHVNRLRSKPQPVLVYDHDAYSVQHSAYVGSGCKYTCWSRGMLAHVEDGRFQFSFRISSG